MTPPPTYMRPSTTAAPNHARGEKVEEELNISIQCFPLSSLRHTSDKYGPTGPFAVEKPPIRKIADEDESADSAEPPG